MHIVNWSNEDTSFLDPFDATPRSSTSISPGPNPLRLFSVVNINNDASDPTFNPVPGSPTSVYSFDSFIEKSYVSTPPPPETNARGLYEEHPRSYFSPDSAVFDEAWDELEVDLVDKARDPFASRNGSATSLGSGKSVIPSVRATAERVTFTRVRAVRRSIRQSLISQFSASCIPPDADPSGGEKRHSPRPQVWRPYATMLKLLHRANTCVEPNEPHQPAPTAELHQPVIYSAGLKREGPPIISPLSFDHGQFYASAEKFKSRTAGSHAFRRSQSTPALKRRLTKPSAMSPESDMESDAEDMDGLHDLTLEATGIAACLSAKWKFEPVRQDEDSHRRRASV